jgi:hypothetical protein
MSLPDISLTRNQRRVIRAVVAVLSAIGAGTLGFPDFVPKVLAHDIQQADLWLVTVFLIINPILDLGADDAKNDTSK